MYVKPKIYPSQQKNILKQKYNALDALEDFQVLQRLSELPQHAADIKYLKSYISCMNDL